MDDLRKRLIYLHHLPNMTWKKMNDLLIQDPNLSSIPLEKHFLSHLPFIDELMKLYKFNHIHVITYFDDDYPQLLKEIYQPPWVLYGKGNIELLKRPKKLAVVGSRKASDYGEKSLKQLIPPLIHEKIVIVSGLATGIDTLAHQLTMENGGDTIAVIAGGLFHIYPVENKPLALKMMEHHLILSEYPPNTRPLRWHFPVRNRIISGLCQGTFIVEAKKKSGSLITANFALQEGREVFALPGNIFSPLSVGTNELIQQGAKAVLSAKDIIEEIIPFS